LAGVRLFSRPWGAQLTDEYVEELLASEVLPRFTWFMTESLDGAVAWRCDRVYTQRLQVADFPPRAATAVGAVHYEPRVRSGYTFMCVR